MWNWLDGGVILGLIAVICVCLPCRWDPAILLSERLHGRKFSQRTLARSHAKRNEGEA
jgi:hypothetical protein